MRPIERWVVLATFAALVVMVGRYEVAAMWLHNLDTSFLLESMRNVRETGAPTTYLGPAFLDAVDSFYFAAEKLCRADLRPSGQGLSILTSHAYFLVYPLGWLTSLVRGEVVLAAVSALAHVGFLALFYTLLRSQRVPTVAAVVVSVLAASHPVIAFGPLGDHYLDRLFLPLGLLFAMLLHGILEQPQQANRARIAALCMVAALAASLTERAAVMMGYMTAVFMGLYWRQVPLRLKLVLGAVCAALAAYVLAWMLSTYVPHKATPSQAYFLSKVFETLGLMFDPAFAPRVVEFLGINLLLFAGFAFSRKRYAVIAMASLLPNLLVTMGGAEKNGWITHYHAMYFPFLSFAAAMGFGHLWARAASLRWRAGLVLLAAVLVPAIGYASPGYRGEATLARRMQQFYKDHGNAYESVRAGQLGAAAAAVPPGAKVTTVEQFMPVLFPGRTIMYYPVGIEIADYAVLNRVQRPDGSFVLVGAISYVGASEAADACLTQRLRESGFDVDNPRLQAGPVTVLARVRRSAAAP